MPGAFPFVLPYQQAIDDQGKPIPGALLNAYVGDSDTRATMYADWALTTPLANPLEADAAGVWAYIFLNPSVTYKLTATGADDGIHTPTQLWSAYPVTTKTLQIQATLPAGTTNNWSPAGYVGSVTTILTTPDAGGSTVGGLALGYADRRLSILNVGSGALTISDDSGSPPTIGFYTPDAEPVVIGPGGGCDLVYDAVVQRWRFSGIALAPTTSTAAITYVIDGDGSELSTGVVGDLYVPFACTITAATLLADQAGSVVVDIWKDAFANYPPTDADSITASAPPTLSAADHSRDTTLTGWTTAISAGDTLRYNVDSADTVTRVTVTLTVTK